MICESCGFTSKIRTYIDEDERLYSGKIKEIRLCLKCFREMMNNVQDIYDIKEENE